MNAVQVLFAVLFAAACVYTVVGYPHRYGALSGRSRLFRTSGLFLLDLLLCLVLLYTFLDFNVQGGGRVARIREILYILSCISLSLVLVCIAVLDALETYVAGRRERREVMHRLVQEEIERAERERATNGNSSGNGDKGASA